MSKPLADEWWDNCAEGRLLYRRCDACDRNTFVLRRYCVDCRSETHWAEASGMGTVFTFTDVARSTIRSAVSEPPYVVAYVDIDNALLMTNVVAEPGVMRIGDKVALQFIDAIDTPGRRVPVFVPAGAE